MKTEQSSEKKGFFGRSLESLGKIHIALGALATGAAIAFNSAVAAGFAAWEFINGFAHIEISNRTGQKNKQAKAGRAATKLAFA